MHRFIKKRECFRGLETFFINDCLQTEGEDSCESFVSVQKPLRRICKKPDEASSGFREDWLFLANDDLLKDDMIHTVKKYVSIDEEGVVFWISQEPPVLHADIPVYKKRE